MILPLDQVTQFSNDSGMKFGEWKYSYLVAERGKATATTEPIVINNIVRISLPDVSCKKVFLRI